MELLLQHYDFILIILVALGGLGIAVYKFITLPTGDKNEKLRIILLDLVIEAEAKFGAQTGKLKFSYVYSVLVERYNWVKYIPLIVINELIEEALVTMRNLLESNEKVKLHVKGDDK